MHIRPLNPASQAEIELVAERMRATLQQVLGPEEGRRLYTLSWLEDRVRQHLDPSRARIFLAVEGEQVLGHTIVRVEPEHGLFSTTWVQPEARRRGVAALLLDHGEHWLMGMGVLRLATNTSSTNTPLLQLYEQRGYTVTTRAEAMVQLTRPVDEPLRERTLALRAPGLAYGRERSSQLVEGSGWFQLITPGGSPELNELLFGDLRGDPEAAIDAVCASFEDRFKWCIQPWTEPADLEARLVARGFDFWSARAMAMDSSRLLAGAEDGRVEVRPSGQRQGAQFFEALLEGRVVGTAGTHVQPGVGYLLGAFVEPEARRQGVYRALVAARLRALHEGRVPLAVTHAKEATSAPILERMGFRTVFPYRIGLSPEQG